MRAVSLPVSPVARNRKDSTPRRAGRLVRCGISIRLTSVVGQESVSANLGGIDRGPAGLNAHVLPDAPTRLLQPLQERPEAGLPYRIVRGCGQEHADPPHALALLRARRERPRGRAAEQCDELALVHSITSSARSRKDSGIVSPSALAVVRLMMRSNFLGCSTGMSPGFAPRRILST